MRRVLFAPAAAMGLLSDLADGLKISVPSHVAELAQTGAEFDAAAVGETAQMDVGGLRKKVQESSKTPYIKDKEAAAKKTNDKDAQKKVKKDLKKEKKEEDKKNGVTKTKAERKAEEEEEKKRDHVPVDPANLTPTMTAWQIYHYMEYIWGPQFRGECTHCFNNDMIKIAGFAMSQHIPLMDPHFPIGQRIVADTLDDFMEDLLDDCDELTEEFKEDYDAAVEKAAAARLEKLTAELKAKEEEAKLKAEVEEKKAEKAEMEGDAAGAKKHREKAIE